MRELKFTIRSGPLRKRQFTPAPLTKSLTRPGTVGAEVLRNRSPPTMPLGKVLVRQAAGDAAYTFVESQSSQPSSPSDLGSLQKLRIGCATTAEDDKRRLRGSSPTLRTSPPSSQGTRSPNRLKPFGHQVGAKANTSVKTPGKGYPLHLDSVWSPWDKHANASTLSGTNTIIGNNRTNDTSATSTGKNGPETTVVHGPPLPHHPGDELPLSIGRP